MKAYSQIPRRLVWAQCPASTVTRRPPPHAAPDRPQNRHRSDRFLIAVTPAVERALRKVRGGEFIRLRGLLMEATHPSRWRWTSSLSRTDSVAGWRELVFVEAVQMD